MATADNSSDDIPFWRRKSLDEMTDFGMGKPVRRLRAMLPQ